VVPQKRRLMVIGTAIAAAFALPGCAPAGYNPADYSGGAQPAANAGDASPSADPAQESEDGTVENDAPALTEEETTDELTGTKVPRMGAVIEDEGGWVLYRFDRDVAKPKSKSNCAGDCAKVWRPALTNDGKPTLKGVDKKLVGTVTRADGSLQLTVAGWPLYRYLGDKKPGTWKGQNVGAAWFVIKPDGTKNLTCLPAVSKPVAPPADDSSSSASGSDSGSGGADYSY
jgi:predicted lipoprotein with Yx(FWY)xxD motif